MNSKNSITDENVDYPNNSNSCTFCGCKISSEQITMWQEEKQFHTECYQIYTAKESSNKEKGIGLIISNVKIINSNYDESESNSPIPKVSSQK